MHSKLFNSVVIISTIIMTNLCFASQLVTVTSPDGNVNITISVKKNLESDPAGERLYYSVKYKGQNILLDSQFRLEFSGMPPISENLQILKSSEITINEDWERVWGRRTKVKNHFAEMTLKIRESVEPYRRIDFIARAYNDGAAFRYVLPDQDTFSDFKLTSELFSFNFASNHQCWASSYGGFATHQESEFNSMRINDLIPDTSYGCPLLINIDENIWVSLTEANLTDWAGMYFTHSGIDNTLKTTYAPWYDDKSILVKSTTLRKSPWRVIMIGDQPGDFLESDIIQNLNEPCAIEDPSWIKPGKSAWDRWWSGDYLPDAEFKVGMNQETMKYFIDFAADMGWEYQLVDWTWYGPPFHPDKGNRFKNPDADLTKMIPEVDIPELVKYAGEKGVKIIVWLEWMAVDNQMDEAFALYEKWGVAGVKIDFMARDDQYVVNFYQRCVKKAAEHHLLVDFHGAYKPTGWSRTYPNVITREGILGNEYTKWSNRVTPDHCLTIPFTRGSLGEMDFTPGGFRQTNAQSFRVVGGSTPGPFVMGTRCYQLAMLVVYESALQVLCDSPYNYRSSPAGLDFLKVVPTTWDDTKVINGKVGDYITVARRSGSDWYIGSMTDWTNRTLEIPLGFLDEGEYKAEIWSDAYEANDYPDRLMKGNKTVTSEDVLNAVMAPGGGHVVVLRPVN